jgi:hypothetical protein
MPKPHATAEIGAKLDELVASGAVRPIVGASFPLEQAFVPNAERIVAAVRAMTQSAG